MAQVKTGISLDKDLFEEAERLARELKLTRSGLYARALQLFIEQRKSQQLLNGLNDAYAGSPTDEETALLRGIRSTMRRIGDQWK